MTRLFITLVLALAIAVSFSMAHAQTPVQNNTAASTIKPSIKDIQQRMTNGRGSNASSTSAVSTNVISTNTVANTNAATDSQATKTVNYTDDGNNMILSIVVTKLPGKADSQMYHVTVVKKHANENFSECQTCKAVENDNEVGTVADILGKEASDNVNNISDIMDALVAIHTNGVKKADATVAATSTSVPDAKAAEKADAAQRTDATKRIQMCEGTSSEVPPYFIAYNAATDKEAKLECMAEAFKKMDTSTTDAAKKALQKRQETTFLSYIEKTYDTCHAKSDCDLDSTFEDLFSAMEVSDDTNANRAALRIPAREVAKEERKDADDYKEKKAELLAAARLGNIDEASSLLADLQTISDRENDRLSGDDFDALMNYRDFMNDSGNAGKLLAGNDQVDQDLRTLMSNPYTFAYTSKNDLLSLGNQATQLELQAASRTTSVVNGQVVRNNNGVLGYTLGSGNVFDVTSGSANVLQANNSMRSNVTFTYNRPDINGLATNDRVAAGANLSNILMTPPNVNLLSGTSTNWQLNAGTGLIAANSTPAAPAINNQFSLLPQNSTNQAQSYQQIAPSITGTGRGNGIVFPGRS